MAQSETKGQVESYLYPVKKASDILTSILAAFCSAATQKGKGINRFI